MSGKWIGFDMGECLGSVMPLYAFVSNDAVPKAAMLPLLYASEIEGRTWIVRPAVYSILPLIGQAYLRDTLRGCFILSNNGSQELVEFLCEYLNYVVSEFVGVRAEPFRFGVWFDAPSRLAGSEVKDMATVQAAMAYYGYEPITDARDLLFFDDLEHVLSGEIPHYVRVPPYFHYTPASAVAEAFGVGIAEEIGNIVTGKQA